MMFAWTGKDYGPDLPHMSTTEGVGPVTAGVRSNGTKAPVDRTKTDKMEESLTCVICQDLLYDCVRFGTSVLRSRGAFKRRRLPREAK